MKGALSQPLSVTLTLSSDTEARLVELLLEATAPREAPLSRAPVLLDRSELAQSLGCSVATVDRLSRDGAPCVWLVESRRFELATVLEWLRARSKQVPE
jgi:hypothetical protein